MSIFAVMIGSFTLLLTQGFEQGWFSTFSFICLSIFIITMLIFIIIERRHEVPFIDFSVLRNRPFIGAFLNNFVLNSGLGVTVVFSYMLKHTLVYQLRNLDLLHCHMPLWQLR